MPSRLVVRCPSCGKKNYISYSASYNTFHWHQWSDTKSTYRIEIFPVQKCNSCWKYYFLNDQEKEHSHYNPERRLNPPVLRGFRRLYSLFKHKSKPLKNNHWELYYPEAKEALEQLYFKELDDNHIYWLLISFLRTYNDWFFRNNNDDENKKFETKEDMKLFSKYIEKLYKVIPEDNVIFRGELLREMWKFDECIELLKNKKLWDLDFVKKQILEHAKKYDKNVFCIEKYNS